MYVMHLQVSVSHKGCEETNECFIPFEAIIGVGGEVTWSNDDTAAHTVTAGTAADGPSGEFDSSLFMAGTTFSHTFESAGEFPYFCMVHPWMNGIVTVGVIDPDIDGDGIENDLDNCPNDSNPTQTDTDMDGLGDVCDLFPNDPNNDIDGDGISGDIDNCPNVSNVNLNDLDSDGTGNACDAETIITSNTILTADTFLKGDLVVEPGVVLTINPGVTLNIDLKIHKVLVKFGGGILIKSGGKIISFPPNGKCKYSTRHVSSRM